MCNVFETSNDGVGGRAGGHVDFGRIPGEGITNAFSTGIPYPDVVTAIGFEGRANVPAIKSMRGPGFADGRFFVR